jgi:hypothetical protein
MAVKMEIIEREFELKYTHIFNFLIFSIISRTIFFFPLFRSRVYRSMAIMSLLKNDPNTPLAYCYKCKAWTPMKWLPKEQRGKRAETWFECATCGGRHLELRYLTESEAKAKNKAAR